MTILFKRKALIVFFTILVFAVAFVGNYVWPPTYESVAGIRLTRGREVIQSDPTVIKTQTSIAMVQMSQQDVNSEIEMFRSKDVLEEVARQLELDKKLDQDGNVLRQAYRQVKRVLMEGVYALHLKTRPTSMQAAVRALDEAIEADPIRDSFLIEVRCHFRQPDAAHAVLSTLLDVYVKKRVELFADKESSPFFESQIARVRTALAEAQAGLRTFREANQIASLDIERQLVLEEYADVKRLLVQLAESETMAKAVDAGTPEAAITETLSRQTGSPVVTEMQMRLLELLGDRRRITTNLGPKHPNVIAVNRQIVEAQASLKDAIQTTRAVAETKAAEAAARLGRLNEIMAELENLEREVTVQSNALEYYSEKLEESRVTDAMAEAQISNVRVASSPTLPIDPIRPRKLLNLVFGLIAGLVGGLALAFFLEYLDHGLKTPEDVDFYLDMPTLGSFFRARGKKLDPAESQRIRTVLEVLESEAPPKFIEVTSAVAGEGAQKVAVALADAYASDAQSDVLLIDFVAGATGRKRATPERPGMVDVLLGEAELDEALTAQGNVAVLGRGRYAECPAYLWNSEPMKAVLAELRARFSYIVFLVGPVLQTPDTLRLASLGDGVVLVVRADSTRREVVARAMARLADARGKLLGAVLTDRKQVIPKVIYRRI